MTHHLDLSLTKYESPIDKPYEPVAPFVDFLCTAAISNEGRLLNRIGASLSMCTVDVIICLRQVSKKISTDKGFCEFFAKNASFFLAYKYSLDLLKRSVLLQYFNAFLLDQNHVRLPHFMALMAERNQLTDVPLSRLRITSVLDLFSPPPSRKMDLFQNLREEDRPGLLGGIKELDLSFNSVLGPESLEIFLKTPQSLESLTLSNDERSVDVLSRMSDQDLSRVLSSVKHFSLFTESEGNREKELDLFARMLRLGSSFESCNIFSYAHVSALLASLTDEELLKTFSAVKYFQLSDSHIDAVQLKRVMSVLSSLTTIRVEDFYDNPADRFVFFGVFDSLSDQDIHRLFRSVKEMRFAGSGLFHGQMHRIFKVISHLKELSIKSVSNDFSFAELIDDLSEDDLRRIFGSVRFLELDYAEEDHEPLARILRASSSLRELILNKCNAFSGLVMSLSERELDSFFSALLSLSFRESALSHQAFARFMPFSRSLNSLDCTDSDESTMLSQLIEESTDEQLLLCFGHLSSLNIYPLDLSVPQMVRLIKACASLKMFINEHFEKVEEIIESLSDAELEQTLGRWRNFPPFNKDFSAQSLARILRVNPYIRYSDVIHQPHLGNALKSLSDERFRLLIESQMELPANQMFGKPAEDVVNYRFLKETRSLTALQAVSFENISSVIDNLRDEELSKAFAHLASVSLYGQPITVSALKRVLKAVSSLISLDAKGCITLSGAIDKLTDEELNRFGAELEDLILTDSNILPRALRRLLKAVSELMIFKARRCESVSSAIAKFSDAELRRIFGQIRDLDLSHTAMPAVSLWRLLNSVQSPQLLDLEGCTAFAKILSQISNEKASTLFAKTEELFVGHTGLTVDDLKRLLRAGSSLKTLGLEDFCLSDFMDDVPDEELLALMRNLKDLFVTSQSEEKVNYVYHQIERLNRIIPTLTVRQNEERENEGQLPF
ncbi:MAG: hypothetical protein KBE16_02090 [Alphaproteobacteria bacterium]|nr:hypothetical protein [Alphaproteobacteria bacterium]MBP9877494.1 hypothetical protein [Alphaproteobacteria bacterium]